MLKYCLIYSDGKYYHKNSKRSNKANRGDTSKITLRNTNFCLYAQISYRNLTRHKSLLNEVNRSSKRSSYVTRCFSWLTREAISYIYSKILITNTHAKWNYEINLVFITKILLSAEISVKYWRGDFDLFVTSKDLNWPQWASLQISWDLLRDLRNLLSMTVMVDIKNKNNDNDNNINRRMFRYYAL